MQTVVKGIESLQTESGRIDSQYGYGKARIASSTGCALAGVLVLALWGNAVKHFFACYSAGIQGEPGAVRPRVKCVRATKRRWP